VYMSGVRVCVFVLVFIRTGSGVVRFTQRDYKGGRCLTSMFMMRVCMAACTSACIAAVAVVWHKQKQKDIDTETDKPDRASHCSNASWSLSSLGSPCITLEESGWRGNTLPDAGIPTRTASQVRSFNMNFSRCHRVRSFSDGANMGIPMA
jgi:hypothetical protein